MSEETLQDLEMTLEDCFAIQRDEEAIKQTEQELLIPNGTYTTVAPLKVKIGKTSKDNRPYAMFSGRIQVGDKTRFFPRFFLSWEKRTKKDQDGNDTGKADRQYTNYVMADKAFRTATGKSAGNVGEVVQYLTEYPTRLRVIQLSDSGENMVVAISPVIER